MLCRPEHPQLPLDDFVEEAVGGQTLAHGVGEARQFDPVDAHHADTAQLHVADKAENDRASSQRGEGLSNGQRRGLSSRAAATQAGETFRATMRSPTSVWMR